MRACKKLPYTAVSLALIVTFAAILSSCSLLGHDEPEEYKLSVHLQTWYDNTPVLVKHNGEVVLDKKVSTGSVLAYAAKISRTTQEKQNQLFVRVDNNVEAETTLVVDDSLYVGIVYTDNVEFKAQEEPFAYF